MKSIVCNKWVIDEADITVDATTRALNTSRAQYQISLYDKNAIEMCVQVTEAAGGESASLSIGASGAEKSRKDVMSRGLSCGYFIEDPALEGADAYVTSQVLAAKIAQLGDIDIAFFGEGTSDDYSQQVGPRVAQLLNWPVVTYATSVEVNGDVATVKRAVAEGVEILEVQLPAVVCVLGDCNTPRIPMMRQILNAKKLPYTVESLSDLSLAADKVTNAIETLSVLGNETNRKKVVIEGSAEDAAAEMVRNLRNDGAI